MGTSYAAFGGGEGSQIANTAGRFDLDAITYWQVRGLGVGEYAARREARAQHDQMRMRQIRMMNRVSREIVEAHAQMLARHRQIAIAERAVERATHSFERTRHSFGCSGPWAGRSISHPLLPPTALRAPDARRLRAASAPL
jgi:hypothetical protein